MRRHNPLWSLVRTAFLLSCAARLEWRRTRTLIRLERCQHHISNLAGTVGRGVSIGFGSSVPPATQVTAAYGQPGSPRNPAGAVAEPVNTATGNYYSTITDLAVPGRGLSFAFARSYNTADPYNGPLGIGWTHSFNVILTVNPDNSVGIKERDGGVATFSPSGGGNYTAAAGVFDVLVKNGDGSFTLTQKGQTRLSFSSAGRLTSIVDKNGNTQSLGTTRPAASPRLRIAPPGRSRLPTMAQTN